MNDYTVNVVGLPITLLWSLAGMIKYLFTVIGIAKTLSPKKSKVSAAIDWMILAIPFFLINFGYYCINIYDDTFYLVTLCITAIIGTHMLYRELWESKVFVSSSIFLFVIVVVFMTCGTTDALIGGRLGFIDPVMGPYTVSNIILFIIIQIVMLSIAGTIFCKLFVNKIRDMIYQAKERIRSYLSAPLISAVGYACIVYATNKAGIVPPAGLFLMFYIPICLIFIVEFVQIYSSVKWATEAQKAGKLIRMDGLTNLNNRLAFEEMEEKIDRHIENNTAVFAVIMIDLNYLKKINDTYGHDKGDIAIKILAEYIQMVFIKCGCYRIGGDEFSVILIGRQVGEIEKLVQEFNDVINRNADGENWKAVSAAIGYAVYDKQNDHSFDDVFRKADHLMYENKKQMKAVREQ